MVEVTSTCPANVTYTMSKCIKGVDVMSIRSNINKLKLRQKQSKLKLKKLKAMYPRKMRVGKPQKKARIAQVVRNGGFEEGAFVPWREAGNVFIRSGAPRTGRFYALFEVPSLRNATISQLVSLGRPGPTGGYTLEFFAARLSNATTGFLEVTFSTCNPNQPSRFFQFNFRDMPVAMYQRFTISLPARTFVGISFTTLTFRVTNFSTPPVALGLDDIRIFPV